MAERAAEAPGVDALLDRLGDQLSSDQAARDRKASVPRPATGRVPSPAKKSDPSSQRPTGSRRASEPLESAATIAAADLHGPGAIGDDRRPNETSDAPAEAQSEAPEPESAPDDGNAGVLERFPASAELDGPRPPLELSALEDVSTRGSKGEVARPPVETSGLAEPSLPSADAVADEFAEFERGELPNDSTRIEDRELLADESTNLLSGEEPAPTLVVESGRDLGRTFTLHPGETGVGRGIDNDIILTDVSVSRKHMRLLCDVDGITLFDLGSGNGTLVNGRRVHRTSLTNGDRIEIGETVLVARLPDAPELHAQATMAGPAESTSDEHLPSGEVLAPPAPWVPSYPVMPSVAPMPEPTPGRGTNILLGRGTLLVGAALLVVIASSIGAIAMALLLHEEPVTGGLGETPIVLPTASLPATALPTPATSPEPVITPPTIAPPTIAPPAIAPPAPTLPVASATPPVALPHVPATDPPVTTAPTATVVAPSVPETAAATPAVVAARDPFPSTERRLPAPRVPRDPRPPRAPAGTAPEANILAAYRRGAFDEAARLAREQAAAAPGSARGNLQNLARNIETFARRLPEARRGNFQALEEAYRTDRRITGGTGAYDSSLAPALANAYVSRGRGAMGSQPADACGDVREALRVQASHADARALLRECETRARRMLGEAQRLEQSEAPRARVIYGDIVSMVGATHDVGRQATARLVAMNRASPAAASPTARRHPVDEDE
jgi:hypothetical protein